MPTKKCEDCGRTTASCGIPGEKSKQRWCRECSVNYPGAVPHIPPSKLCIICGKLQPKFGLPPDGKARWCGPCHKEHAPTAVNVAHKKCEDCNEKMAGFTLPGSKTPRWCAQCSDKHPGAEMRGRPKCEVCHDKPGSFGMPGDPKARWCKVCAADMRGAERKTKRAVCEDCSERAPSMGLEIERKVRWCRSCANESHPTAVQVFKQVCEDCKKTTPNYGPPAAPGRKYGQKLKRWCAACSKAHADAVNHAGESNRPCETCAQPAYCGLASNKVARWCRVCAPNAIVYVYQSKAGRGGTSQLQWGPPKRNNKKGPADLKAKLQASEKALKRCKRLLAEATGEEADKLMRQDELRALRRAGKPLPPKTRVRASKLGKIKTK